MNKSFPYSHFSRLRNNLSGIMVTSTVHQGASSELNKSVNLRYGSHRWALTFTREDKSLGVALFWKHASEVSDGWSLLNHVIPLSNFVIL